MSDFNKYEMYEKLGISKEVYEYCERVATSLKPRFDKIDEVAEYNQLKVLNAMQRQKFRKLPSWNNRLWL